MLNSAVCVTIKVRCIYLPWFSITVSVQVMWLTHLPLWKRAFRKACLLISDFTTIKENKIWRQSIPQLLGVAATAKRMFFSTGVPMFMAFPTLHPPQDHRQRCPGPVRCCWLSLLGASTIPKTLKSPYKLHCTVMYLPVQLSWKNWGVRAASQIHPCLECTKCSSMSVPYSQKQWMHFQEFKRQHREAAR